MAEIPSVRILPMSDKIDGFRGRTIEQVQREVFLHRLPGKMKGRYPYRATGLNSVGGTVVLFQFQARIIASAVFLRDEKHKTPRDGHSGIIEFDPKTFRTFTPVDVEGMQRACPAFQRFGHVKQYLNPAGYPAFKRRLKNVQLPTV